MMQGAPPASEPITVTYLDVDHLIKTCGLTGLQRKVVDLLMRGYTEADIAQMYGKSRESVVMMFSRAVKKMVEKNNADWLKCAHRLSKQP